MPVSSELRVLSRMRLRVSYILYLSYIVIDFRFGLNQIYVGVVLGIELIQIRLVHPPVACNHSLVHTNDVA